MIKFDLDGVLADFSRLAIKLFAADGITIEYPHDKFQWTLNPKITNAQMWKYFYRVYDLWEVTNIYHRASDVVNMLFSLTGEPVQIITARPINSARPTNKLIKRIMGGVPYMVAMTDSGEDKYLYLGPDDILVEDRRRTCMQLARLGIRTIIIDKEYNKIESEYEIPEIIARIPCVCELLNIMPRLLS